MGERCPLSVGAGAGHAFYAAGYNEVGLICCNSWGRSWGDLGRFTVSWSDPKLGSIDDLLDVWVVEKAPYFSESTNAA
jgi:C1A family cysteine protease